MTAPLLPFDQTDTYGGVSVVRATGRTGCTLTLTGVFTEPALPARWLLWPGDCRGLPISEWSSA